MQPAGRTLGLLSRGAAALDRRGRDPRHDPAVGDSFYLLVGPLRISAGRSGTKVPRFTAFERACHWLTATSFVVLGLTGLNITFGKLLLLPLIGPDAFSSVAQFAKYAHNYVSFSFVLGLVLIVAMWMKDNIPRKIDVVWLKEGGGFIPSKHPTAGRFNAGEKLVFWLVLGAGVAVAVSGYLLMFPFYVTNIAGMQVAQVVHSLIAVLFIALIIGHIYIGTLGMEGAFEAMGTGSVDLNWAKEHHGLWLEERDRQGPRAGPAGHGNTGRMKRIESGSHTITAAEGTPTRRMSHGSHLTSQHAGGNRRRRPPHGRRRAGQRPNRPIHPAAPAPGHGGTDPGPRNLMRDRQNPDVLVPPSTDHGTLPNLRFSFSDAHMRLETGGWTRQVTVRELGISKTHRRREHAAQSPAACASCIGTRPPSGPTCCTAARASPRSTRRDGNFVDDVGVGDLWYFPSGIPHSIQGLGPGRLRVPSGVRRRRFRRGQHLPDQRLVQAHAERRAGQEFRRAGVVVRPHARSERALHLPGAGAGTAQLGPDCGRHAPCRRASSHRMMAQEPIRTRERNGADQRLRASFPVSKTIAAALVEVNPGGLRELHWHPNTDEWQYYIEGQGRMGVFGASGQARTFDFQAGDVGYVPFAMGHYIENTGTTPLRFLEMFKSSYLRRPVARHLDGADAAGAGEGAPEASIHR